MTEALDALRSRIAAIDRAILDLIHDRLALVRELGVVKDRLDLPVRLYQVEAEVLTRWRELAGQVGLDAELAAGIARRLIEAAILVQEERTGAYQGELRRILVVGGRGAMGSWLAGFFSNQGHRVNIFDVAGPLEGFPSVGALKEGLDGAEVVVLATPLSTGPELYQEISEARPSALVFDIFSLKSHVQELLREGTAQGLRLTSLHPMFGAGVRTLAGRVLAVCDCGNAAAADEAAQLFEETALAITRLPVEEHDALIRYILGLSHLVSILFAQTLQKSGHPYPELGRLSSTTFQRQVRAAREIARENPYLYYEIQHYNAYSPRLFDQLRKNLEEVEQAVFMDDPEPFVRLIRESRGYLPEALPEEMA